MSNEYKMRQTLEKIRDYMELINGSKDILIEINNALTNGEADYKGLHERCVSIYQSPHTLTEVVDLTLAEILRTLHNEATDRFKGKPVSVSMPTTILYFLSNSSLVKPK